MRQILACLSLVPLFGISWFLDEKFGDGLTRTERFNRSCGSDVMTVTEYENALFAPPRAAIRCERSDGTAYYLFRRTP